MTQKIKNGGTDFPIQYRGLNDLNNHIIYINKGMTLRDYFAAHASDEDVRCIIGKLKYDDKKNLHTVRCEARYIHADAMIAEREKINGN